MKSKGSRNQPAPQDPPPMSPTARGAKYRNRDGSKFITLPDTMSAPDSAQPSPTTSAAFSAKPQAIGATGVTSNGPAPAPANVNRKKQKRREKAAAKAAAEAALNAGNANGASDSAGHRPNHVPEQEDSEEEEEDQFNNQSDQAHAQVNGRIPGSAPKSKKSKKKRHKGAAGAGELVDRPDSPTPQLNTPHTSGISKERIWNTSSQEERERIKEFWLGLGEDERKSLVKVEKEAVLKKMKEQQKHTCSCSVCGRKRHAIEEELEGLYDAYYEELKQFANHPQQDGHPPLMGASRHFGFHHGNRFPSYAGHQPSRGRIVEHVGEDDEDDLDDEAYSEDELDDDEAYSDEEEPEEEIHRDYASEFFNFGSSLTVQGGILTVADDLLKNDGKKFIEMMEQLAERRMAREGDFAQDQYSRSYGHGVNGGLPSHDHPPPPPVDDEEYEDDEDEDYDSQEDDEYEEEDDDTMTEEQRMEEGRRMFQIFAARMFEQRVLQAYREKVARERQAKLMEEEEEELRREAARKEKKSKEAQKKKEKAAQKKQAQAEEKARREAEKKAEEERRRLEEGRKAEEAKRKAEEKRKKKEAQRKAEEDERARKEAERQRQKQLQADQERKAKEAKDREKKAREEARLKEKEERERSDREAKELKGKQDSQKRQKELESKSSENGSKSHQKQKQEERAAKKAAALAAAPVTMTLPKRPAQHPKNPALPVLPQQPPTAVFASPKPSVATPALPKAPTPMRPRLASQQDGSSGPGTSSLSGSASNDPSPSANTPAQTSPRPSGPPSARGSTASQHSANVSRAMSPAQPSGTRFPSAQPAPINIPPMGMPFPPGLPPPGFGNPLFPPGPPGFRQPPPGMVPPGLSSPMLGRGFPAPAPPPGFGQPASELVSTFNPSSKDATPGTHTRQQSGGYDSPSMHPAQPISRPTPIGRPSSVVHGQRPQSGSPPKAPKQDSDDMQDHLGSSALLDDSEDVLPTLPDFQPGLRRGYVAPGRPGPAFPPAPFADPAIASMWGSPMQPPGMSPFGQTPVVPPGFGGPVGWPVSPSLSFSAPIGIGRVAPARPPASVAIRQILCNVCCDLAMKEPAKDGFIPLSSLQEAVKTYVDFNPMGDGPLTENDIVALCETEGNMANGGGSFDLVNEAGTKSIRWNPDKMPQPLGAFGAPGQPGIGSPVLGSSFGH
ncbi:stress response protein nst1 [Diaporthe sp. PMI_573]|nr:stress response protein nst1 [Diaporthaceae sp. PMI_573]